MSALVYVLAVFAIAGVSLWLLLQPYAPYRLDDKEYDETSFWRSKR